MEVGLYLHPGHRQYPLDLVLWSVLRPRHLQIRRRLLFRLYAGGAQPAAERQPAGQPGAADPAVEPDRRDLSLSGRRPAAFRAHQSAHRAGLDRAAPAVHRPGRRPGQQLGRHDQAIRGRRRSAASSRPTTSPCPRSSAALGNANINVGGREITVGQQSVNIRGIGLIDSGGADDLTKGYQVDDIENVVLDPGERRPGSGEGCRQGLGRLCAAARHRRQRPR